MKSERTERIELLAAAVAFVSHEMAIGSSIKESSLRSSPWVGFRV